MKGAHCFPDDFCYTASDLNCHLNRKEIHKIRDEAFWKEVKEAGTKYILKSKQDYGLLATYPLDIFCIERGAVKIDYMVHSTNRILYLSFGAGTMFNLIAAMTGIRTSICIELLDFSIIWRIPGKIVNECTLVARHPCISRYIMEYLAYALVACQQLNINLSQNHSLQKLCNFLLNRMEIFGNEFILGVSQEEFAEILGIHRATLARDIKYLKSIGIVEQFTKGKVKILDMNKLLNLSGKLS